MSVTQNHNIIPVFTLATLPIPMSFPSGNSRLVVGNMFFSPLVFLHCLTNLFLFRVWSFGANPRNTKTLERTKFSIIKLGDIFLSAAFKFFSDQFFFAYNTLFHNYIVTKILGVINKEEV